MAVHEEKEHLRRAAAARRAAIPADIRREFSEAICRHAELQLKRMLPAERPVLFAYMPFGAEADMTPLIERCWLDGVPVAAPLSIPQTGQMKLHLVTGYDDLQPGPWGIREPLPVCPVLADYARIGCILMPGLAFDRKGGRLGYGGGYYDRFLAGMAGSHALPFLLAPAFDIQVVPQVPTEPHDYRLDGIATEHGFIDCRETRSE